MTASSQSVPLPVPWQEMLASGVKGHFDTMTIFFEKENDLQRDGAVVQQSIQLLQPLVNKALDAGRDPDVSASEFEAHVWWAGISVTVPAV